MDERVEHTREKAVYHLRLLLIVLDAIDPICVRREDIFLDCRVYSELEDRLGESRNIRAIVSGKEAFNLSI